MKKAVSLMVCVLCIFSLLCTPVSQGITVFAENEASATNESDKEGTYSYYLKSVEERESSAVGESIVIDAKTFSPDSVIGEVEYTEDSALILNEENTITWNFGVQKSGFYNIALNVTAVEDGRGTISYSALIDGATPFEEINLMEISRRYKDQDSTPKYDASGNQLRPQIEQEFSWHNEWFKSSEGLHSDYFKFYFEAGEHSLTLIGESGKFAISNITLLAYEETISYKEYLKENSDVKKYDGKTIKVEAETSLWRSSASILPQTDMQSPYTSPYSSRKALMNTMGGPNWKYPWDTICWNVNVPEDGLYRISIRYRQNYLAGMSVYRSLTVNGEIPFTEAKSLAFTYDDDWQISPFSEYYIRLNKGDNQITLTVTMSEMADIVRELQDIMLETNRVYREIVMLVGSSPDTNRDYNLDKQLPSLKGDFKNIAARIDAVIASIEKSGGGAGQQVAILKNFSRQLKEISKKTYTLTRDNRLGDVKSNISSLGSFISTLREQALEIDSFYIGGEKLEKQRTKASFLDSLIHKFLRFIASFLEDYVSFSSDYEGEAITVWLISSGRDQMQILKNMIEDDFTVNYNIPVNLELVAASVVQADFAGKGPDVALGNTVDSPVNYALRGISADISEMQGFDDVIKRFSPDSMTSYKYKDGYYGLPETQGFSVMFCRNDILEDLGVEVPETWDDLLKKSLPVLRSNNLEIGIGTLESIQSMTGYNIFTTLLYQNGGTIYEEDLKNSALDSVSAFQSFTKAISYYTDYKFPQSYDSLNRFRSGEMPILMANYTFYNSLAVGAPEIDGLWDMYCIPGTVMEDGSINRTQVFSSTSSIILEKSNQKDDAWKFLKWWSSANTQTRYGLEVEAVLGASGRYAPANIEATANLPWSTAELKVLEAQRSECVSLPQLPGSYFTSKAINNAFLSCVLNPDKLPREELLYWSEQIDIELERKRKEFEY